MDKHPRIDLPAQPHARAFTRRIAAGAAGAAIAVAASAPAFAQAWPAKPVRWVVPFSAGGVADIPARIIGQRLSESLGQQIVIENRPGAGGTLGSEAVARAQPDGYSWLVVSNTNVINAALYGKLPYDPVKDFTPVIHFASTPNVLVVHPSFPAKSVKELIDVARKRPKQIFYASSGNGSSQHLFAELFESLAKIDMEHVPFKGSGPAIAALVGGEVSMSFTGMSAVLPFIRAGKLRALGVTTAKRNAALPDVPAIAEQLPGYDATLWLGLLAPANTPRDIVGRMNAEVAKVLRDPSVRRLLVDGGNDVIGGSPEEFGKLFNAELVKWAQIVKAVGAKID
ncbi:MAG: tripartite tricarboxylate transporter substrate binding protein [bacterium]|nr:tripartite tricarboxylate transporter substrate binding protein [Betaproteobacteria bacterium]